MKQFYTNLLLLAFAGAQAQDFTWVNGSNTSGVTASYGTLGVSSPLNDPGDRHACGKWVDAAGNLWLHGGESGSATWENDLWKYNTSTNEWTWMHGSNTPNSAGVYGSLGVSAPSNEPGAREFTASWTDAAGNFWMFGGYSGQGYLGDLWKYNPSSNEWTWMHGFNTAGQNGVYGTIGVASAANFPGCRYGAGTWVDAAGNFWLFGGRGYPASGSWGYLNDLWKFDPVANQWTWISGSDQSDQNGVYGSLSTPSSNNIPGGRYFPSCWYDQAGGGVYVFGGFGIPVVTSTLPAGYQNDLWKYDPVAGTWTWLHGSSDVNNSGVYGTQNSPSPSNVPGGRYSTATWTSPQGHLLVFGGRGLGDQPVNGQLNDLFSYNPGTNQWTWLKGSTSNNANGTYGTQGVAAPANVPGARMYNTWWTVGFNHLWLYGGEGYDGSNNSLENLSDLWYFKIPCNPDSITVQSALPLCSGSSFTLTAVNGNATTIWYDSPVSTSSLSGGPQLTATSPTTSGTFTVISYYAESNSCTVAPRTPVSLTVYPTPTLSLGASHPVICQGESSTLTVSGALNYNWTSPASPANASVVVVSPPANSIYQVSGTDQTGCSSSATISLQVDQCLGLATHAWARNLTLFPNPNRGNFQVSSLVPFPEHTSLSIYNHLGQKVSEHQLSSSLHQTLETSLPAGVYYYQLKTSDQERTGGKLVIE